jgi:hypothetical protein
MFNSMTKKSIPPRVIFILLLLAAFASLGGLRYAGYHFFPSSKADPHALHAGPPAGPPSFPPSPLQLPLEEIPALEPEALRELQALRLKWVSCQQILAVAQQSSLEGLPEHEMAAALAAFAESHHEQILQVAALEQQIGDFVIDNAPDITAHPALSTPDQARSERSRVVTERSRVVTERSRVVTERSRFSPIREALVKDGLSLEEAEARWPAPPLIP